MSDAASDREWNEIFYSSQDGLRLYARHYPAKTVDGQTPARSVLCLAGLARNSKDFHKLALHLSRYSSSPRDVYCLDYRGRGQSQYDPKWQNYSPYIELLDTLDFMTLAELHHVSLIGTSRGGIIAMLMGVVRPGSLGAVVLNDIGPVIEARGLARIIGYVGKTPTPQNWEEAALIVRDVSSRFFTDVSDDEWLEIARQIYGEEDGYPVPGYDNALAKTLSEIDLASPIPQMWPQFGALAHLPMLVLRGENSDLLSNETVKEMAARHSRLESYLVEEEGHPPMLRDHRTIRVVDRFLLDADSSQQYHS
ncbi:MAG: alpha/beta hydrolase [Hyphomicrobiaceae bacterium]|nr:alpha/beta hydrolase [Hyphomicrobiaceae bacterium]